jgi:hypothetical protein
VAARGLDHLGGLQLAVLVAEVLEHPGAAAKEHGHEVDLDLVDQPDGQVLLADARPTHHADILVAGGGLRQLQGTLDSVYTPPSGCSAGGSWVTTNTGRRAGLSDRPLPITEPRCRRWYGRR